MVVFDYLHQYTIKVIYFSKIGDNMLRMYCCVVYSKNMYKFTLFYLK